ncbi:MAG TPA: glutathione S-transferase N-terminal domain-containing protein [Polyangia bacterium]
MSRLRLITIPFSHYCEKARFGLDYAGLPFEEEAHLPMLAARHARRAGGRRTVPVLVTDKGAVGDSTDILQFCDRHAADDRRLYPPALADEVRALEDHFDEKLGPHVRRLAFFHALPSRGYVLDLVGVSVPAWQRLLLRASFPLLRAALRRALRIDAAGAARSQARVDEVFAEVAQRLAGGQGFLIGDRFSAADLTFAALASPLLRPAEHPRPDQPRQAPASLKALQDQLRATPAGRFALRIYERFRRPG